MEYTDRIFHFVVHQYPHVWQEILALTRLHQLSSVKKVFHEQLQHVEDLNIFNQYPENIPNLLLQVAKVIQRNALPPGDSYGTLLTCRASNVYTQEALDKRHLKDQTSDVPQVQVPSLLQFEIFIYTSLNQIIELTNRRKYTTIFVKNYTIPELLRLSPSETCYFKWMDNEAYDENHQPVCLNLKTYIIAESFVPGVLKIIQKPEHKHFMFRHIHHRNIVAFTDLKYIYDKCGLVCFAFNLRKVVKLQFFKHMKVENKHEQDILNILIYLYYSGMMLSINRNGLKKNVNRSGLDRCCFEAIRQNLVSESLKGRIYGVRSLVEGVYFGMQFNAGAGFKDLALIMQQPWPRHRKRKTNPPMNESCLKRQKLNEITHEKRKNTEPGDTSSKKPKMDLHGKRGNDEPCDTSSKKQKMDLHGKRRNDEPCDTSSKKQKLY